MLRLRHRSHLLPVVIVMGLAIALVAGVGVCVAEDHAGMHHGGSAAPLCVGAPGGSPVTSVAHVRLPIVGDAVTAAPAGITPAPLDVLELPPKA